MAMLGGLKSVGGTMLLNVMCEERKSNLQQQ